MRGGRDGRARGMGRRGRLWRQYRRGVRRLSVRPSPAFATLSPHAGRGEHLQGNGEHLRERIFCERENENGPLRGRSVSLDAIYFVGAAAGVAAAFRAKSPARNTLSASGLKCLRMAALTWSTVSAAYFASRSAVNCIVRP